jgi:hypothetical protein
MQILCPTSNRPEGVNNLTSGGLKAIHIYQLNTASKYVGWFNRSRGNGVIAVEKETYDNQKGTI